MPTTYTHYYFGCECLETLPALLQKAIRRNRGLYNTGVHGPDIFFYYDLYKPSNKVISLGVYMHDHPARPFFERCKKEYKKHPEKKAMLAYIFGFLSHFALDSTCHGYIDRKKEVSGVTHHEVEAEYDAHLMRKQGLVPTSVDRTSSLSPTLRNARIISYFFDFSLKEIHKTLIDQVLILTLLRSKYGHKRKIFRKVLDIVKPGCELADFYIDPQENPVCRDSNLRLDKLRAKALILYPKLAAELWDYLNDRGELSDYFDHDFEPWPDYKEIPILSYEEELKYEV